MKKIRAGDKVVMSNNRVGKVTAKSHYDDNGHRFVEVARGSTRELKRTDRVIFA